MAGKLGNESARNIEGTANEHAFHRDYHITGADRKFALDLFLFDQLCQLNQFQLNDILCRILPVELQSSRGWLEVCLYPAK